MYNNRFRVKVKTENLEFNSDVYQIRKEEGRTYFLIVYPDRKFGWVEMRNCELSC